MATSSSWVNHKLRLLWVFPLRHIAMCSALHLVLLGVPILTLEDDDRKSTRDRQKDRKRQKDEDFPPSIVKAE